MPGASGQALELYGGRQTNRLFCGVGERGSSLTRRIHCAKSRLGGSRQGDHHPPKDRALAAKLGANARATVLANFDWRQICAKIECIYDRLLAAPTEAASTQNQSAPFATRAR